jgi:hypothetical protein
MGFFVGKEQLTVSSASVGLASVPGNAKFAILYLESASIRMGDRTDVPTSTDGIVWRPGQKFALVGTGALTGVRFIRDDSTNATLNVRYMSAVDMNFIDGAMTGNPNGWGISTFVQDIGTNADGQSQSEFVRTYDAAGTLRRVRLLPTHYLIGFARQMIAAMLLVLLK